MRQGSLDSLTAAHNSDSFNAANQAQGGMMNYHKLLMSTPLVQGGIL